MNLKLGRHQFGLQNCARKTIFALSIFLTVGVTFLGSSDAAWAHEAPIDFSRLFCSDLVPVNLPRLTQNEMMRWDEAIREVAARLPIDPQALDVETLASQPQRVMLPFKLSDLFTISKQDSHIHSQMQLSSFAHRNWSPEQLKRAQELLRELASQQKMRNGLAEKAWAQSEKDRAQLKLGVSMVPPVQSAVVVLDMGLSERAVISRFDLKNQLAVTSEGIIDLKTNKIDRRNRIQAEFEMRSTFLYGQSTVSSDGRFVAIKNFADPTQLKLEIWDRESKKSWSLPITRQTRALIFEKEQRRPRLLLTTEAEEFRSYEIDLAKLAESDTGPDILTDSFSIATELRSARATVSSLENRRFSQSGRFVHSMKLQDGRVVSLEIYEKDGLHARVVDLLNRQTLVDAVTDLGADVGRSVKVLGVNQARNGWIEFVIERETSKTNPFDAIRGVDRNAKTMVQTSLFGLNLIKGEMKLNGVSMNEAAANSFEFFGWSSSESYQVVRTRMDNRELIYVMSRYQPKHGVALNRLEILTSEDLLPILKEYSQVDFLDIVEDKDSGVAELVVIAKNPDDNKRALFRLSPAGKALAESQPLEGDKVLTVDLRDKWLDVDQEQRVKGARKDIVRTSFPFSK